MWILPKKLIQSNGSLAMVETISDLNESSQICASELFVRSKSMQSKTFLRKWKTDSWRLLPYGRIAKPSQHNHSLIESIFLSLPIRANHSQAQENDKEKMTKDTFGRVFICGYEQLDLFAYSSKMSKDTFRWDSPQSSVIWKKQVMKHRGEYSLRVNASMETMKQQHIKESEFLSWPTSRTTGWKSTMGAKSNAKRVEDGLCNLGEYVHVMYENWPTPAVMDVTGGSYKTEWKDGRAVSYHNHTQENPVAYGAKLSDAVKCGLPDPDNHNTNGNLQESWPTPTAVNRVRNEETMEKCLKFRQSNGQTSVPLYLEEKVQQWATPIVGDSHLASTPEVAAKRLAEGKVTLSRQNAGKLNQRWVETLMGLPLGWTCPLCPPLVIRNWSKFLTGWLKVNHA